jgi:predicted nucleic acid-binding protein
MRHLVPIFRKVQSRQARIVVSAVTEAELLVRPYREDDLDALERIAGLLSTEGIEVLTMDRKIARQSAVLRARHGLQTADAIIVATAIEAGCDAIVGNDKKWLRLDEIAYVHLDEIAQ